MRRLGADDSYRIVHTMKKWSRSRTCTLIYSSSPTDGRTDESVIISSGERIREWCVDGEHNEYVCSCLDHAVLVRYVYDGISGRLGWQLTENIRERIASPLLSPWRTTNSVCVTVKVHWRRKTEKTHYLCFKRECMYVHRLACIQFRCESFEKEMRRLTFIIIDSVSWPCTQTKKIAEKENRTLPKAWQEGRCLNSSFASRCRCVC